MRRWLAVALLLLGYAAPASAQDGVLVVVVDPGETQVNQAALIRAIGRSVERTAIRMTDERAPSATGRLTIAFSRPNRWVLRYESRGQVAWISDRVSRPHELRSRLAALSRQVVERVDGPAQPRGRGSWDDVIIALRDEIVDPFAEDPPMPDRQPVSVLWSEVVDPFADGPGRAAREVWTEVLDPWSSEVRRARR